MLQNAIGVHLQNATDVHLQNAIGIHLQNATDVNLQNAIGVHLQNLRYDGAVVCIYLYIHTVMNTTILQLVAIYKIQLHVSALYVVHHQVAQRTY